MSLEIKNKFEVVYLKPEGWTILSPWVQVYTIGYRHHCGYFETQADALNICDQLNSFLKDE